MNDYLNAEQLLCLLKLPIWMGLTSYHRVSERLAPVDLKVTYLICVTELYFQYKRMGLKHFLKLNTF